MDVNTFIDNYKQAFGENTQLPFVFGYRDTPVTETEKINGCFFKVFKNLGDNGSVSLYKENIGCGGGKFYTGFTEMPEMIPNFVSNKEKYKETPELVSKFLENLNVPRSKKKYLNISRIDKIESFEEIEGLLFFANPDVLSGLATWAYFDNNADDAVTTLFGSGCSVMITQTVIENNNNGKRTFIGLFDPSVRPHVAADVLGFAIPMSRFREMYHTMRKCSLFDTHAWNKVRERINR